MKTRPFWRTAPLSADEEELLALLDGAHAAAALRDSPSTLALKQAAAGSGRVECGLAAALTAIGGRHAPVKIIAEFLSPPLGTVAKTARSMILEHGAPIPGWGSSFVKRRPDPDWAALDAFLFKWPDVEQKIRVVTSILHEHHRLVYPNPGCYTAAAALILGLPPPLAPYLFVRARLGTWSALAYECTR